MTEEAKLKEPQQLKKANLAYAGPPSVHNGLLQRNHQVRGRSGAPSVSSAKLSMASQSGDPYALKSSNADATREEKLALKETEEEFKRRGFFKRIFPCVDFLYYK